MVMSNRAMWVLFGMAAAAACAVAMVWPARTRGRGQIDDQSSRVDEASEDSFPASDPPSFSADRGAQASPVPRA
jgi:hypothetical protein